MGLHSGLLDPACWGRDKGSGRIHYSGEFLNTAKHVGDAAHGGMLMLSEATLGQLHLVDFESTAAVMAMGEHLLVSNDAHSTRLFQAVPLALASRLAHFQPPRTAKVLSQSVLAAPVGFVAVAFVNAVGVQSLMAWDADLAQEALDLYQSIAGMAVVACSGYVVETSGGLCLAAFPHAGLAVACCVKVQGELTAAEWAPELLKHELCEDICILAPSVRA
jgi:class 3 adenylate cyclase